MGLDVFFSKHKINNIGYFRKVNFLVAFFESKGFDTPNQTPLTIQREWIEELIDKCETVLKQPQSASEILPTMDGFFFGSTAYDSYYFEDVQEVLTFCKETLLLEFDNLEDDEYLKFETWY